MRLSQAKLSSVSTFLSIVLTKGKEPHQLDVNRDGSYIQARGEFDLIQDKIISFKNEKRNSSPSPIKII